MLETIKKEWKAQIAVLLFALFTVCWVILRINVDTESELNQLFAAVYGVLALWGSICGISIGLKWGGLKSIMGKAIIMLSLGLFFQELGQIAYSYYIYFLNIEVPYPSIGDIGYFGSIFFYIYGVWLLGQASGIHLKLQLYRSKIQAIVIPLLMLGIAYYLFLQDYTFDWTDPIKIFLDFGYPFGQAIYISIAILAYLLSRNILGGVMKDKILFILFALWVQFISDYTFLYQSSHGTWTVGGVNDYMYLTAYFLMTLGLLQLNTVLMNLQKK